MLVVVDWVEDLHLFCLTFTLLMLYFRLMAIQQCDLVLVHIYPQGEDTLVSDRPKKDVSTEKEESSFIVLILLVKAKSLWLHLTSS